METIQKAYEFARRKHKGQKYDDGTDYFYTHPKGVAAILCLVTKDVEVIAAGFLHDVIEDTDTSYEELKEEFGQRVADLVMEVTHEGKKDEYGYYFPRLRSKEGIMIKLADRLSNISHMDVWSKDRQQHYLKKTKFWKDGGDLK